MAKEMSDKAKETRGENLNKHGIQGTTQSKQHSKKGFRTGRRASHHDDAGVWVSAHWMAQFQGCKAKLTKKKKKQKIQEEMANS